MNKYIILMTILCLGNNLKSAAANEIDTETMEHIDRKEALLNFLNDLSSFEEEGWNLKTRLPRQATAPFIVILSKEGTVCIKEFPKLDKLNEVTLLCQLQSCFYQNKPVTKKPDGREASYASNLDELIELVKEVNIRGYYRDQYFGGPAEREVIIYKLRGINC